MIKHQTREGWLIAAVEALTPLFSEQSIELPAVRVSVGFPGGRGPKTGVIGQCWNSHASSDAAPQIFIHPSLVDHDEILATLVHELVHAADDCESGHKGQFVKWARAMGLEGKPTATHAGQDLVDQFKSIIEHLGDFPHAALGGGDGGGDDEKKQSTRMIKVECPSDGYIVRTTRKWLEIGVPTCPCGTEMQVPE